MPSVWAVPASGTALFIEKQEEIKMTYEEALDNVYGRLVFGIKPGLERITALMERLGNPQKKLKFVHVAE